MSFNASIITASNSLIHYSNERMENQIISNTESTELEVVTINQGRSRSSHFHIIKPTLGIPLKVGQPVRCVHPKTKQVTKGIVTKHYWTIDWNDPPEGFLLGIYGMELEALRSALMSHDPGFAKEWATIVLIKETN